MRRYFLYSHDGQGLGHARRHLAIARALVTSDPRAAVLIATGVEELPQPGLPPHVELLRLPALRKVANERYESRRLPLNARETRAMRSSLLLTAVKSFRPHVVLADKHPFGASGEFRHALAASRRLGARAALGLRDILDDPATVRREWRPHGLPDAITDHYDELFIYGQREVFDAPKLYGFPAALAARTSFVGYVINAPTASTTPAGARPLVVASTGGGEDGLHLLQAFLRAAVDAPWRALAVTGPHCPDEHNVQLAALAAEAGAEFHTFMPGLEHRLAAASACVCMGGYNTLGETIAAGVPIVCVPRVVPRLEQFIRARAFAALGLLRMIPPDALTPERLGAAITASLSTPASPVRLDFRGAAETARRLRALADQARAGVPEALLATA
jgi:predicted glycosyltransferase